MPNNFESWHLAPQQPFYVDDQAAIRQQPDRDSRDREICAQALADYNAALGCSGGWLNILDCRATRERMATLHGLEISDDEQRVFEMGTMDERHALLAALHARLRERLDRAVAPTAHDRGERAIAKLQKDHDQIEAFAPVLAKYGAQGELGRVLAAIRSAIDRLRAKVSQEFSTSWHPDPRQALSAIFPEDAAIYPKGEEPAPPPAPSPEPPPSTLSTAAQVASARARR